MGMRSLQTRVTVAIVAVLSLFAIASFVVNQHILYPQFVALEREKASDDLVRCREAITREMDHLSTYLNDWSSWDDTYQFVVDHNPEYVESNLGYQSYESAKVNLRLFLDAEGRVIHRGAFDLEAEKPLPLPEFAAEQWPKDHPLLALPESQSVVRTLVLTSAGPMLVASRHILTSQYQGPPRGTLIFGRLLTDDHVARLRAQTRVEFAAIPLTPGVLDDDDQRTLARLPTFDSVDTQTISDEKLAVAGVLPDWNHEPALLIRASVARDISARGAATLGHASLSLALAGIVTLFTLVVVLRRIVIAPLADLTDHASRIGDSGDLYSKLDSTRADEIGQLARGFDEMMTRLAEARSQLTDSSRKAGMAEVASGVLHNVGNVLNNITISTSMIGERVKQSKVTGLAQATALLNENRSNLDRFINADERGQKLLTYLSQLGEVLSADQKAVLGEIESLRTSLEHLNQIVQSQHAFAHGSGHEEPIPPGVIAAAALTIMDAGFVRHEIQCTREFDEAPTLLFDRQKVLQILVNLLTNAKDAVGGLSPGLRKIHLRVQSIAGEAIRFEIRDNGGGIAADDLTKIFTNGFSTKDRGRGYGLHYCANAAREMGGSLKAHSDGPGRGASFTLELPWRAVAAAEVA